MLIHSFYSSANPSGENAVVLEQAEALRSAGHDVESFYVSTDEQAKQRFYRTRSAGRVALGMGMSPQKYLHSFQPDVIHVHNTFPNLGTRWIRPEWSSRTIVTAHNFRTVCANGLLFRDGHDCVACLGRPIIPALLHRCYRESRSATLPLAVASSPHGGLRRLLHSPRALVVLNQATADLLRDIASVPIHVIPNFVDAPQPSTCADSLTDPEPAWLFVGRLSREKGIMELLRSWPAHHRLDVIGGGPLADQVAAEAPTSVRVLGQIPREQVLSRMGRYSGLFFPSPLREGSPTVILEALARGLPIASNHAVSVFPALLAEEVGVDIGTRPTRDSVAAAIAIMSEHRDEFRKRALDYHERQFSRAVWLRSIEALYGSIS